MRADFLSVLFLAASAALPVDARMTSQMVKRSLEHQKRAAVDAGHLQLLTEKKVKRSADGSSHRRHHSNKKRACSAGTNYSTSSAASGNSGNSTISSNTKSSSKGSDSRKNSSSSSSSGESGSSGSSTSSTSDSDTSSDTSSSSSSGTSAASGSVSGFSGTNTGIGSWFRTNSGQDSTNGRSWCQLNYEDTWMGFAPSVGTMLKSGTTAVAGQKYCGREAKATNPKNGKTALIYIVDGFDDKWVKTPGSIDLTVAAFTALYGSFDGNKNTVITDLEWEFTGNVKEEYKFNAGG